MLWVFQNLSKGIQIFQFLDNTVELMFKNLKKILKASYFGFPMPESSRKEAEGPKRGVALLVALLTIMLMVGLVADMIISSAVNLEMAASSRDRIRSEYLAKSGFNFGVFFLSVSWAYDLFRAQPDAPQLLKKDLSDDPDSLWAIVNKLPPVGSMTMDFLEQMKKSKEDDGDEDLGEDPFGLSGVMNEDVLRIISLFEEGFTVKIQDESNKINLNECFTGRCTETLNMLTNLFSCSVEKEFLSSKNISPKELAYRTKDFISDVASTSSESGFSDKDSPYLNYTPSYKTKGLPFDTLEEWKLVEGVDDDIFAVFSPYLTVYPYPKAGSNKFSSPLNINFVKPELLKCLLPSAQSYSCAESFAQKMHKIKRDNSTVYETSIEQTLQKIACLGEDSSSNLTADGEKMDPKLWFDNKSNAFRIEVTAITGDINRKLSTVVKRVMPGQSTSPTAKTEKSEDLNNPDSTSSGDLGSTSLAAKGGPKASYNILYWRLD